MCHTILNCLLQSLYKYVAQPNVLQVLNLADCDTPLDSVSKYVYHSRVQSFHISKCYRLQISDVM